MPWQPWHWASLFCSVTLVFSAAGAESAAPESATATTNRSADMRFSRCDVLVEATADYSSGASPGSKRRPDRSVLEDRFPGLGRAEVVALSQRDADLGELAGDLLVLDVLGDGLQPQAHADLLDRFDQRVVEVVLGHALDEEAVDLEAVHREVLEVVERGEAAAEIVEQE